MAKGGLFAVMDFSAVPEDEFNDWYDTEHLPERQRIAGFSACERWIGADNPKLSVGSYDLDSAEVLNSPAYKAISGDNASPWSKRITGKCKRMMRVSADQIFPGGAAAPANAGGFLINAYNVAPEHEAEIREWSIKEHLPALAAVDGALSARLFISPGGSHRFMTVYHLASPEVQASPAWKKAAGTPWTAKMLPLIRDRLRVVCRRYVRAK